ncbi:MAG: type II secretion system F family protein [Patescibacteria group bacterium]
MPSYNYQARTKEGEVQTGVVEAGSQEAAVAILQRHNLIVISLGEVRLSVFTFRLKFLERIGAKDVMIFSRQLSTLFEAKVPLTQSLKTLANQTENDYLRERIVKVLDDVTAGSLLSAALAKHPKAFTPFYVNMVRSGEAAGKLQEVFIFLADYLEREYYLNSKARSALIYPAFILVALTIVGAVMLTVVVPRLSEILKESGQELPILTRIIIGAGDFFARWFLLIFGVIAIVGVAAWRYLNTPRGKDNWDFVKLKLPIVGKILRQVYLSRLANNLSTLIQGGISIVQALEITSETVGNAVFRDVLAKAKENVKGGKLISATFETSPAIPPLMSQMIAIGEQTGKLSSILLTVAKFYQKEVDSLVDNIVALLEPALILVFGVGVGILVIGILMPIYNLAGGF